MTAATMAASTIRVLVMAFGNDFERQEEDSAIKATI